MVTGESRTANRRAFLRCGVRPGIHSVPNSLLLRRPHQPPVTAFLMPIVIFNPHLGLRIWVRGQWVAGLMSPGVVRKESRKPLSSRWAHIFETLADIQFRGAFNRPAVGADRTLGPPVLPSLSHSSFRSPAGESCSKTLRRASSVKRSRSCVSIHTLNGRAISPLLAS